jgi:hypothetical protein
MTSVAGQWRFACEATNWRGYVTETSSAPRLLDGETKRAVPFQTILRQLSKVNVGATSINTPPVHITSTVDFCEYQHIGMCSLRFAFCLSAMLFFRVLQRPVSTSLQQWPGIALLQQWPWITSAKMASDPLLQQGTLLTTAVFVTSLVRMLASPPVMWDEEFLCTFQILLYIAVITPYNHVNIHRFI